jgi:hypothetical protein
MKMSGSRWTGMDKPWIKCINRMGDERIANQILHQKGLQDRGRNWKKWKVGM